MKKLTQLLHNNGLAPNTRYVNWLADVHSGSFAPAFTLSVSRRTANAPANRQMPIASVVMGYIKKRK